MYAFWTLFFTVCYQIFSAIIYALKMESFIKKTESEKYYYVCLWVANVHHLTITIYTLNNLINSNCEGAYPFIWLFSEEC
jgi:hypothetical protein